MKKYIRQFKEAMNSKLFKILMKRGWEQEQFIMIKKECLKVMKKLKFDQGAVFACLEEAFINSNFDSEWRDIQDSFVYDDEADELSDKEWKRLEKIADDMGFFLSSFLGWDLYGCLLSAYFMADVVFPDEITYIEKKLIDAL